MARNQEIIQLAKSLKNITSRAVIEYKRELDDILNSNCCDKHRIERTLDGMLDFCFDASMLELYRKLCKYYYAIDPNATAHYVRYYREIWDPEEDKKWKKAASSINLS